MSTPVAYLMENDESKWLGYEPDPCADRVTPLYKEKWKMTKDKTLLDVHAEQVESDCAEIDRAFAEVAPSQEPDWPTRIEAQRNAVVNGMKLMIEAVPTISEILDEKDRHIAELRAANNDLNVALCKSDIERTKLEETIVMLERDLNNANVIILARENRVTPVLEENVKFHERIAKLEERNEWLRKFLHCVETNLSKGMSKSMQWLQAEAIREELK